MTEAMPDPVPDSTVSDPAVPVLETEEERVQREERERNDQDDQPKYDGGEIPHVPNEQDVEPNVESPTEPNTE